MKLIWYITLGWLIATLFPYAKLENWCNMGKNKAKNHSAVASQANGSADEGSSFEIKDDEDFVLSAIVRERQDDAEIEVDLDDL